MMKKILNWITAHRDKNERNEMLNNITKIDRDSSSASNMKTNDFLRLLNINIVKYNYSTIIYTKVLLALTVILVILTLVLLFITWIYGWLGLVLSRA